jgi:hypothetical protein
MFRVVQVLQDGFLGREVGFEVLMRDGRAGVSEPRGDGRHCLLRLGAY